MVPVKEAINSGTWLYCECQGDYTELIKFRLKIKSFRQLNLKEVDEPEKIEIIDSNSKLWILETEVVSLTKNPIRDYDGGPLKLILVDQDDFSFHNFYDQHLNIFSNFAIKYNVNRFHSFPLAPKIKAIGSIIFQLPDDDEAEYSISIQNKGFVREV